MGTDLIPARGILLNSPRPNIFVLGALCSLGAIAGRWRPGIQPKEIPTHLPPLALAQAFDARRFDLEHQAELNGYLAHNRVRDDRVHPAVTGSLPSELGAGLGMGAATPAHKQIMGYALNRC